MVFGELVEPSSRCLWDDDLADDVDVSNTRPPLEWLNTVEVPSKISSILIGEKLQINSFLRECFLDGLVPLGECAHVITVYCTGNNSYIILYNKAANIILGEVTELLIPWLKSADSIYCLTSVPLSLFQNCRVEDAPCIIRCLATSKAKKNNYTKLEVPNLVTGLCASIVSFCAFQDLACTLFVAYVDAVPIDSISAQPILDLMKHLQFIPTRNFILENKPSSHNLYM